MYVNYQSPVKRFQIGQENVWILNRTFCLPARHPQLSKESLWTKDLLQNHQFWSKSAIWKYHLQIRYFSGLFYIDVFSVTTIINLNTFFCYEFAYNKWWIIRESFIVSSLEFGLVNNFAFSIRGFTFLYIIIFFF